MHMFGTRVNDICPRDLVIIEPGNTTFIESFGCLQKSVVIYDKRNIQDKISSFWCLGGKEGNCILIPASLKLGVTMAKSKTQMPGIFLSNFYESKFKSQKIRDLQTTDFLIFALCQIQKY